MFGRAGFHSLRSFVRERRGRESERSVGARKLFGVSEEGGCVSKRGAWEERSDGGRIV